MPAITSTTFYTIQLLTPYRVPHPTAMSVDTGAVSGYGHSFLEVLFRHASLE